MVAGIQPAARKQRAVIVYFHGVPGAAAEVAALAPYSNENEFDFLCIDRFALDHTLTGEAYFHRLADLVSAHAAGRPVMLVGFSIGAFVALQTSRHLTGPIHSLQLVSAAAPLESGAFLEHMAGKQVFALAQSRPLLFKWLTLWQAMLARRAPGALYKLLFANAVAADRNLVTDPAFRAELVDVLRTAFDRPRLPGYLRDIHAYVQPWQQSLAEIRAPTQLWQGDADNWSPAAMAEVLQASIKSAAPVNLLPGLSHYSCLLASLPKIVLQG
ncbi:alpha/beta hydrolase [Permianibacter sp. IMCC34836]|uniref:alpha/beta fold hydrolase n=1 Tax=Permianibacter fluminis TaxID=2738515 RepID=UPI0015552C48|nr:alpha/beta hydrolase [Permianibacter fluminis]NQD36222.1 alpha/beta hydrolase [Permianibacter fluminis]